MTATKTPSTEKPRTGTWNIDPAHSSIAAVARHMMVTKVRGRFTEFDGEIEIADDIENSSAEVTVDAASIDTNSEDRDQHLRSEDFLYVDEYPELTFESTDISTDGETWQLTGDLTIRGKTNSVTLDVDYLGVNTDPFGMRRALFEATTELERANWDITWNQALETGGVLVSRTLDVQIQVSAVLDEDS